MRSVTFWLVCLFLGVILLSTVSAQAASIVPSLTGSIQDDPSSEPWLFLFHNADNQSFEGQVNEPTAFLGLSYLDDCGNGVSCDIHYSGDMRGMDVWMEIFGPGFTSLHAVVTQGSYSGHIFSEPSPLFDWTEMTSYNFVGAWAGMDLPVTGSVNTYYDFVCTQACEPVPGFDISGSIVTTTPEPNSLLLIGTGLLGGFGALRKKRARMNLVPSQIAGAFSTQSNSTRKVSTRCPR